MKRFLVLLLILCAAGLPARSAPAPDRVAVLKRGLNITGWFRFPSSRDPAALRQWLSDAAIKDIAAAGFTFVRLATDPAVLETPAIRDVWFEQIRRLQRVGLGVMISPHPVGWNLDTSTADQARLEAFWRDIKPSLKALPPRLTFAELLNEPVFRADPPAWWRLQRRLLTAVRAALPAHTIVLTGQDWGGIGGLLTLPPEPDGNVVYSFHFYDPPELTSLAAYRPGLDRAALARLAFPSAEPARCELAAAGSGDTATRELIRFYCATGQDEAKIRSRLTQAADWAARNKTVLVAGEFGASAALNPAARIAWLSLVRETCEAAGIGWALWGYDDVMGFNISRPPPPRPVLDRSLRGALGLAAR